MQPGMDIFPPHNRQHLSQYQPFRVYRALSHLSTKVTTTKIQQQWRRNCHQYSLFCRRLQRESLFIHLSSFGITFLGHERISQRAKTMMETTTALHPAPPPLLSACCLVKMVVTMSSSDLLVSATSIANPSGVLEIVPARPLDLPPALFPDTTTGGSLLHLSS